MQGANCATFWHRLLQTNQAAERDRGERGCGKGGVKLLRANDRPVSVPAALTDSILGVTGLDNAAPVLPLERPGSERRPASGHASASDIRAGEEVRIPVKEDRVHVEKEAVVTEEVEVGKRKVQDTEHVSGQVRHEELKIEKEGNPKMKGDRAPK